MNMACSAMEQEPLSHPVAAPVAAASDEITPDQKTRTPGKPNYKKETGHQSST